MLDAPIASAVAVSILRGALWGLVLLAIREIYRRLRGREGIGLGDVKLAGVAGAWLDWMTVVIVLEIAALAALALYAVRQSMSGRPLRVTGRLPFGLTFAPAIWIGWLLEATVLMP
jgi:leader peptidase (prepilin peptidase)/N-methyltransferase